MNFVPAQEEEVEEYLQVPMFVFNLPLLLRHLSLLSVVIARLGNL